MNIAHYTSDLENKASKLKAMVLERLSAIPIPEAAAPTAEATAESCGNRYCKALSVLSYLLLGGGAVTLLSEFLDIKAENTTLFHKIASIAVGTIEFTAGAVSWLKPEILHTLINKLSQESDEHSDTSVDLSTVKNAIISILPELQNNLSQSWDDFLGAKKSMLLTAIEQSNVADQAALTDFAIKRSVLQPVSANILGDVNDLDGSIDSYKKYLTDFAAKCNAAVDAALAEQMKTAEKIAEKLG